MFEDNNDSSGPKDEFDLLEENERIIATLDEDGNEHFFIVADEFFWEGNKYALLVPVDGDGELLQSLRNDMISGEVDTATFDAEFYEEEDDDEYDEYDEEDETVEMEAFIFRVIDEDGEEIFEKIEDDEELTLIITEWEKRNPDIVS